MTDTVNLDIVDHNVKNLNINEETHMTNYGNESELHDYQVRNCEMSTENRPGTWDEGELGNIPYYSNNINSQDT
jgi:hypothetical protein